MTEIGSPKSVAFESEITVRGVSQTDKLRGQKSSWVRDHLANERTYLAWMRSAIALMGFGVLIVRLRYLQIPQLPSRSNSWKLGLLFAVVGLMTVLFSTLHYFAIRHAIDEETYKPSSRWVFLFSLAVTLLGTGVIYFVFTVPLNSLASYP